MSPQMPTKDPDGGGGGSIGGIGVADTENPTVKKLIVQMEGGKANVSLYFSSDPGGLYPLGVVDERFSIVGEGGSGVPLDQGVGGAVFFYVTNEDGLLELNVTMNGTDFPLYPHVMSGGAVASAPPIQYVEPPPPPPGPVDISAVYAPGADFTLVIEGSGLVNEAMTLRVYWDDGATHIKFGSTQGGAYGPDNMQTIVYEPFGGETITKVEAYYDWEETQLAAEMDLTGVGGIPVPGSANVADDGPLHVYVNYSGPDSITIIDDAMMFHPATSRVDWQADGAGGPPAGVASGPGQVQVMGPGELVINNASAEFGYGNAITELTVYRPYPNVTHVWHGHVTVQ